MADQFSVELGLTEPQRQQILPFLQDEVKQLAALKKNTKLSAEEKLEKLKEVGSAIDAKIAPLLNPQQQQKFQVIREDARRRIFETMGSEAVHEAEGKLKKKL